VIKLRIDRYKIKTSEKIYNERKIYGTYQDELISGYEL